MTEQDQVDRDTVRQYIDKLDRAFASAAASESRLGVTQLILSLGLLALSFGLVSVGRNITISGLTFSIPVSTLLIVLAALSVGISVLFWSNSATGSTLASEIEQQYGRLGFGLPAKGSRQNPWGISGTLENPMATLRVRPPSILLVAYWLSAALLGTLVAGVPAIAQGAACVRFAAAVGGSWAWLSLLLPTLGFLHMLAVLSAAPLAQSPRTTESPASPDSPTLR